MVGSNPITVIGCLDDGADGVVTCGGGGIGRLEGGPCRLLVGAIEDMFGEEGIDPKAAVMICVTTKELQMLAVAQVGHREVRQFLVLPGVIADVEGVEGIVEQDVKGVFE